jgi:hypothetical protein
VAAAQPSNVLLNLAAGASWLFGPGNVFYTKRLAKSFDRYCHLAAVLPSDTVGLVMDIIVVIPTQQSYQTLKERLLSLFKLPWYERLDKLFTGLTWVARKFRHDSCYVGGQRWREQRNLC